MEAPQRKKRKAPTPNAKPRRRRKTARQTATPAEGGEDAQEDGAEGEAEQEEDDGSDPELHEIDPNTVTMYGLSYDRRHGKTSVREKQMSEIDWVEVARKRYEELEAAAALAASGAQPAQPTDVRETTEGPSGTAESRTSPNPSATEGDGDADPT